MSHVCNAYCRDDVHCEIDCIGTASTIDAAREYHRGKLHFDNDDKGAAPFFVVDMQEAPEAPHPYPGGCVHRGQCRPVLVFRRAVRGLVPPVPR